MARIPNEKRERYNELKKELERLKKIPNSAIRYRLELLDEVERERRKIERTTREIEDLVGGIPRSEWSEEQIREVRRLNDQIRRSNEIIREDEREIKDLEKEYPDIEEAKELIREIEEEIRDLEREFPGIDKPKVEGCSYFSTCEDVPDRCNDFLESKGSLVFVMNHRDTLPEFVYEDDYDGALQEVRGNINRIFGDYIYKRNRTFDVAVVGERLSSGRIPEGQCRNYRVYEFEVFRFENGVYEYSYALTYSNGVAADIGRDKMEQGLINEISTVLRRAGFWERR